jgi:hypothetical protein
VIEPVLERPDFGLAPHRDQIPDAERALLAGLLRRDLLRQLVLVAAELARGTDALDSAELLVEAAP